MILAEFLSRKGEWQPYVLALDITSQCRRSIVTILLVGGKCLYIGNNDYQAYK